MQYETPQFIDIEDKTFGPLTFKQFAYLAGAAGITVLFLTTLPALLAFLLASPFIGLALALAFYKINGKPFIEVMEHAIVYFFSSKLYLWKQRQVSSTQNVSAPISQQVPVVPSMTTSKLKDLAWSLNIKGKISE